MRLIKCTFDLNNKETSVLACSGFGVVKAFSGQREGRDNPADTSVEDIGPIPKGTYFIVDRVSGGHLGFLFDLWGAYGYGTTDHRQWFMLWNPSTGDSTVVNGVRRRHFRLHPMGPRRLSEGCITVVSPVDFDRFQKFLRSQKPEVPVPHTPFKAYGTVEVR